VVSAVAFAVLTACGVTLWLIAPRPNEAHAASASLLSRSDWVLATALPTSGDFPADWGYALAGRLRRAAPTGTATSSTPPRPRPATAAYEPAACAELPKILDQSSGVLAAYVQVDRYTQIFVQDAVPADAAATGERREHGPNARFSIWAVPDSQARIAGYLDWLGRCGSYRVTNYDRASDIKSERTVTTQVEAPSDDGADAAVGVTRTFTPTGSIDPPSTYHVAYYSVRGVLLECTIYVEGADADMVRQVAAHTLQKLRDL
jgi:hypothetical protein